jgi:hypothetical protein
VGKAEGEVGLPAVRCVALSAAVAASSFLADHQARKIGDLIPRLVVVKLVDR